MMRAALRLPVLALLLSGAAAHGLADTGSLAAARDTGPVSATASIHPTATPAGSAVLPPAPASAAVASDGNTGPTGRLGPNDRNADHGPAGRDRGSTRSSALNRGPLTSDRSTYRDHYAANGLTRTGFPSRSATAPPHFHSD